MNYSAENEQMFYRNQTKQIYTDIIFLSDIVINKYSRMQRKSSPMLAKRASVVLRSKRYGTIPKSLAGSVLSQAAPKAKIFKRLNINKKRKSIFNQSYKKYR